MAADASANDEKTPTNKSPSSPLFGMLEAVSSGSMKLIVEPTLAVTEGAMKVTDGAVKATANVARSIQSEIDGSASSKRATEKGAAVKVQAAMRGKAGRDTAKKEMAAKYPASSSLEAALPTILVITYLLVAFFAYYMSGAFDEVAPPPAQKRAPFGFGK